MGFLLMQPLNAAKAAAATRTLRHFRRQVSFVKNQVYPEPGRAQVCDSIFISKSVAGH